ncbi:hypothetical protein ACWGCW_23865 [Streptomyces sp. NPDC054933]
MGEILTLSAVDGNGATKPVKLRASTSYPYTIEMAKGGGIWEKYEGDNLFSCLLKVRVELEHENLLLCCQGARRDVFTSGMQSQMSGGRLAYVLHRGRPLSQADEVDIFAPALPEQVATVADQRAAVMEFFKLRDSGD